MVAGVSVRWLTEQRQLGLVMLAGATGLDRRIEWAHSIELADPSPWLHGNELLLTTGLRLSPTDGEEQRKYVETLHRAGVIALGFGIGLSHARVPDALVAAAESAGLPLLQVPLPTPFIAVIRAVTGRIAQQQYEGVTRASRVQPRMTRAALHGGNRAVLRELVAAIDGRVLQFGADLDLIAAYPAGASAAAGQVLQDLRRGADPPGMPGSVASMSTVGPTGVVTALRLQVGHRLHGYLALVTAGTPTSIDHLLLGHAASLICLEQEKPLRLREAQNRFNEMLVGLLLDDALTDRQTTEQLRITGLPIREGVVALAIGGGDPHTALTGVDRVLQGHELPLVGAVSDGHAVVLLPSEPATLIDEVLAAVAGAATAPAGFARADTSADIVGALRQAVTAARLADVRGTSLVNGDTMAGHSLMAVPAARAALVALAADRLRPLAENRQQGDADLVGTLRAFLEYHGHWEAASAAVGIHRHTLHKRVDRIQVLLGADLDSAHERAELLLCLSVWSADPLTPGDVR